MRVRTELSEYLLARWRTHWMHNLLVACAEIDQDDLNCYRSTQDAAPPPPAVPPAAPGPATPPPFVDAINLDDLDLLPHRLEGAGVQHADVEKHFLACGLPDLFWKCIRYHFKQHAPMSAGTRP